jgi:hypothetical protein
MSNELKVDTKNYIAKKLVDAQEAHKHGQAWCNRDPKKWALVANHIIQKPDEVSTFMRKNKITRNFYYDVQTELMADPESSEIRNAWASEISSVMFQGLDTYRQSQDQYSSRVENGEIEIDGNELFKQGKSLQAFNDIHSKLTGNNVQRVVVEHKTTLDEAEEYARKMLEGIQEAEIVD